MRLPYPMEAFYATTDYFDHLCALPQSQKRSSRAIFPSSENQFPGVIPASLCLLFLPHLPWLPHRNNRPRSHPPHFASTASIPTHPPPQSSKVRRFAPPPPPFAY